MKHAVIIFPNIKLIVSESNLFPQVTCVELVNTQSSLVS